MRQVWLKLKVISIMQQIIHIGYIFFAPHKARFY
ncbi:hypothetical protein EcWSU1_02699 [Enterobacter ludwigii]|uniref:Uncharacterized protein n=1 Tax=Enterobacter ludwigii TaxID=299767 RepID=G8LG39_9ENTR|nr:hypothetical protein EcWSU1_02699 [Enterobacter ludwigii]